MAYEKARNDLLQSGAQEPEPENTASQPPIPEMRAPLAGDKAEAQKKESKRPVLPKIEAVLTHRATNPPLYFPDQRRLTQLYQNAQPKWSNEGLTAEGKNHTSFLSKQTIQADSTLGPTAAYLQDIGKFKKGQKIKHSPLAFTTHTESLSEPFPRDLFAVFFCYTLGLLAPMCLQTRGVDKCEGCNDPMDRQGHHRMSCKKTSSYNAAHSTFAAAVAHVMHQSSVQYADKGVPTHLTNNKIGDALCNLSNGAKKLILDYTVVHPRIAHGRWNPAVLATKVTGKWTKHGPDYAVLGLAFAACAATTYGQLHEHILHILYIAAQRRAELLHVYHRPLVDIDQLFGTAFAQSRARVGAALARGMALRAFGTKI